MNTVEPEAPTEITNTETAWTAMLEMANGTLMTNDPLIGFALVSIAAELRATRLAKQFPSSAGPT